ncbi:penicillin acylase family protein [Catenulispora pinisilvae]|uniref:penicillin acylase family protein n=1 Tax=Catenulispora pinisilvae TaxID=2705253 RepID=UPI0018921AD4|nr:penicillin acylase family protein [Catenulispora pinisilvae]
MHIRARTMAAALTALAVSGALAVPAVTASATSAGAHAKPATIAASGVADDCLGQCNDILPPGENGSATTAQILWFKTTGNRPSNTDDQLGKYASLVDGYTGLTNSTLGNFFNDSSFGVPANQVTSTLNPGGRGDVTITRDTEDIPHIYGTTRSGTEYGAGYAAGQDRLWMMDVFRHVGRGELSGFAGGAAGNRQLEQQFYLNGAYTEPDLQAQVDRVKNSGPRGAQAYQDMTDYLAGLNQYIADVKAGDDFPGEYDLTGNANILTGDGIQNFQPTDLVAIGSVIGALFGAGGGNQVASALVKEAAEAKYGTAQGDAVWNSFREENDPEADLTLHDGQSFPFNGSPANASGVAMPDPGSVSPQQIVFDPTGSAASSSTASGTTASTATVPTTATGSAAVKSATSNANLKADPALAKQANSMANGVLPAGLFQTKRGMSNALVVSGQYTDTGNPVAVFGPQTGYFAPQLLMLEEIQGPGISARGAAFAGLNFYVELGRGADYSWSATSAGQDMIDTFAVTLCNTDGTPATKDSDAYLYNGVCTPMQQIERDDSWSPTIADSTPAGSYKLIAFRTNFGIVQARATVGGKPVAYTALRSTYQHEVDTIIGFQMFNDPSVVTGPAGFQQAASNITYTFNWFYVDSQHTAYYNSGLNPTRPAQDDPNLPITADAAHQWLNWDPSTNTVANTPFAAHPNSIDQDYYVSWNNKIANGYTASGFGDGSIYRSNLLDDRVKGLINSGTKVTRANLTQAMEDAALTDLRGEKLLPELLQVIGTPTDPTQAAAVAELKTWLADGAKRKETTAGSKTYSDSDAIRIMDAWWPLLVQAEFQPGMGSDLYTAMTGVLSVDDSPYGGSEAGVAHKGSSFQSGWYSYVDKDLRSILGESVQGPLAQSYCGGGNLTACRTALLSALSTAVATPAATVYPADSVCSAGDQWCADSIQQHPLGGITDDQSNWQNRPTFQQVVQYPAHRGANVSDLATKSTATASSSQSGYPAQNAVTGNGANRWASNWDDNEWLQVDLGSVQQVGRVMLNWEAAYGKAYNIEVSDDGTNWRTVYTTTTGHGGQEVDSFPVTSARYVRMQGVQRATGWGYSLYQFQVYAL